MEPIDDPYATVIFDSYIESECSPNIPDDDEWLGILINVPDKYNIKLDEPMKLPICGGYLLETKTIMGLRLVVHLYNVTEPDKIISAQIAPPPTDGRKIKPPQMEPLDSSLFEGMVTEAFFNIDATKHLTVPLTPGTYTVTVSFGDVVSNAREIKLAR